MKAVNQVLDRPRKQPVSSPPLNQVKYDKKERQTK